MCILINLFSDFFFFLNLLKEAPSDNYFLLLEIFGWNCCILVLLQSQKPYS